MNRARIILAIQAALCVLLALVLVISVIGLYREGAARRAEDPLAPIFTREAVVARLAPLTPLLALSLCVTAAGFALGIRDPGAKRPAKVLGPVAHRASSRRQGAVRAILIAAAIALIVLGAFNGSARDVFTKAANICTECIGLG